MTEQRFDCLVIGSGPLPGLVAGFLAQSHDKRVALIGSHWSPFQLQRQIPVAAALWTRPESLKLLARLRDETTRLLGTMGKGLVERGDMLLVAEAPESIEALSHFRHMARALGWPAETTLDRHLPGASLVRLRDVARLVDGRLGPALESWLERVGVTRLPLRDIKLTVRRDATIGLGTTAGEVTATQVLLADDAAILAHAPQAFIERQFAPVPMAAFLVEDSRALGATTVHYVDRGLLLARGPNGAVHVLASGDPLSVEARIGTTLSDGKPVRGSGEVRFMGLATPDGAPLLGPVRGEIHAIGGLQASAPFFAPLIARYLAGSIAPQEAEWLAIRGPARRVLATDYQAALP